MESTGPATAGAADPGRGLARLGDRTSAPRPVDRRRRGGGAQGRTARRRDDPAAVERRQHRAGRRVRGQLADERGAPRRRRDGGGRGLPHRGAHVLAPTCTSTPTSSPSSPRWTPQPLEAGARRVLEDALRDFRRVGGRPRRGRPGSGCASSAAARASCRRPSRATSATGGVRRWCRSPRSTGLPEDYVAEHPAVDGMVEISTEYPDTLPFLTHAPRPRAAPPRRARLPQHRLAGERRGARRAARGARGEGHPARVRRLAEL